MNKYIDISNLTGFFLVATPQMSDPRFYRKVIYICSHTQDGVLGLVLNDQEENLYLYHIFDEMKLQYPAGDYPRITRGGPVDQDAAFILFSGPDRYSSLSVTENIHLSRESKLLEEIAAGQGPENFIFFLGYAGWDANQLEAELMGNFWFVAPSDETLLFGEERAMLWQILVQKFHVDDAVFNKTIGHS